MFLSISASTNNLAGSVPCASTQLPVWKDKHGLPACVKGLTGCCGVAANGNSNGMPPPPARFKADDDDIFGDAGTDYICELPKV